MYGGRYLELESKYSIRIKNEWISQKGNSFSIAFHIFNTKRTDWISYLRKHGLIGLPLGNKEIIAFLKKEKLANIEFPG